MVAAAVVVVDVSSGFDSYRGISAIAVSLESSPGIWGRLGQARDKIRFGTSRVLIGVLDRQASCFSSFAFPRVGRAVDGRRGHCRMHAAR